MSSLTEPATERESAAPQGGWTALIDDIVEGRWTSPRSGAPSPQPATRTIVIEESLDGAEADLVARLGIEGAVAVVAAGETWDAMGARVARARAGCDVREVVLAGHPHAEIATAEALAGRLEGAAH
ncbi:MAG: sn-glycerol-1-phosphate dehydrogenase, partial [Pseudomonadota bacterium]